MEHKDEAQAFRLAILMGHYCPYHTRLFTLYKDSSL